MSKEKMSSNENEKYYSGEELTDSHPSNPDDSELKKIKSMYLPDSKADHAPSEKSIEDANGLEHPEPVKPKSLI
ncbi:hypothetical protein [Clostridium beijerinckii]|uniref:hypothetical protein n=1 Tax=Clostridium beijerinckii TaxID=1520 RepID=UPI00047ACCF0|nr:hypothetical protein [Clostridium beijerinckii]